ncbi:protein of unknown function [Stenotrophomonas maltophilia]|nr:protein of unknown function [Stenotrophomonas maltophilia]
MLLLCRHDQRDGAASRSSPVCDTLYTSMTGAMCAAEDLAVSLDTVSDDGAIAVGAARGERMDRAFERIERAATPALVKGEALVVVVAAHITGSHRAPPALE